MVNHSHGKVFRRVIKNVVNVDNVKNTSDKGDWNQPDVILAGGGLSGLTLALELARQPFFQQHKILLLDRDEKDKNDRTWCFWAAKEEVLPPVTFKTWDECRFFSDDWNILLDIAPYCYHMVRGLDFYRWAKLELEKYPNVRRLTANITGINAQTGCVYTDQGDFTSGVVFNSAFTQRSLVPLANAQYPQPPFTVQGTAKNNSAHYVHLLQHFQGWTIETPTASFDPQAMTFMDYRLEQYGQTRFVYVLPFSATRALVEFTVFSPALCPPEEYDRELNAYVVEQLKIKEFAVVEREFGVIPMTDRPFALTEGRVINIGTAGGFVKASSGYAFLRTQRRLRAFVAAWVQQGAPDTTLLQSAWHYRFFDSIMLHVLQEGRMAGKDFFARLFRRLPAPLVLRFLDEDANFREILRLLSTPPTGPFLTTAMARLLATAMVRLRSFFK